MRVSRWSWIVGFVISISLAAGCIGTDRPARDRSPQPPSQVEPGDEDVFNGADADGFEDVLLPPTDDDAGTDATPGMTDVVDFPDADPDDDTSAGELDAGDEEPDVDPEPEPMERPGVGDVVISEFMARSQGGSDPGEYIEFYNGTSRTFDLSGCGIDKTNTSEVATIASGVTIAPGAYVVFARNAAGIGETTPTGTFSFQLANGGGGIALVCDEVVIDELVYLEVHAPLGVSYQKDVGHLSAVSPDLTSNWCATPTIAAHEYVADKFGTPGRANLACP